MNDSVWIGLSSVSLKPLKTYLCLTSLIAGMRITTAITFNSYPQDFPVQISVFPPFLSLQVIFSIDICKCVSRIF